MESTYEPPPEVKTDDPVNGLCCFINPSRECGADCMAYTIEPCESKVLSAQQKNCTLLISIERLGRYAGALVKLTSQQNNLEIDKKRSVSPPNPRGTL